MNIENQQTTQPPTTPAPKTDDLPLAITRAVEQVEKAAAPPSPPVQPSPAPGEPTPPSASGDGGSGTQPRAPDGKFAPKDTPTAPTDAATAPTDAAPAATPSPADQFPASWRAELKEQWGKLDPAVRTEITRREQEIQHGLQASARRAQAASAVLQEFEPYAEILQAENISPVTAMRDLLGTAYALRSAGPEYRKAIFLQLAQQYGVDLTTGINSAQARAEAAATQADVTLRTQRVHEDNAQIEHARNVLTQFANSPGHEHFPHVAEIMGNLMATGVCGDLETAYQQACALHPQLRPALIRAEAERINRQQAADAAARAAASASVGNTPGALGAAPPAAVAPANQALRASLEAAFERATR